VDPLSCSTSTGVSNNTINAISNMLIDYEWAANRLYADIHFQLSDYNGSYRGFTCDSSNNNTIGMMLSVNKSGSITCYKHIHPDEGSVYDFTYWTRPDTHPGNAVASAAGHLSPIMKWADSFNEFTLSLPSSHSMDRWENNKVYFDYVGRAYDSVNFMDLPSMLRTQAVANIFSPPTNTSQVVVVCGSYGEVTNDNSTMTNVFSFVDGTYNIQF